MTRLARPMAWVALLVGSLAVLRLGASGDLAAPPLSAGGLGRWVDARDPATVAVALVRLAAEGVVWYLLALTALHAVAALFDRRSLHAVAAFLTAPGFDRLLRGALGAGVIAVLPVTADAGVVAIAPVGAPVPDATPRAARVPTPDGTATMRPLDDPATGGTARMVPHPAAVEPPAPVPTTWQVAPGESFWSIAEEQLAQVRQRPPRDNEVVPYWRAIIDANRHRLVDPDDPDLILPGQVLELPPIPS